jgi:hypothetical protein
VQKIYVEIESCLCYFVPPRYTNVNFCGTEFGMIQAQNSVCGCNLQAECLQKPIGEMDITLLIKSSQKYCIERSCWTTVRYLKCDLFLINCLLSLDLDMHFLLINANHVFDDLGIFSCIIGQLLPVLSDSL